MSSVRDVEETLATLDGAAALACNQVGFDIRAFVVSEKFSKHGRWFVNPTFDAIEPIASVAEEGCLSFPGLYIMKPRDALVRASWLSLDGTFHEHVWFDGFFARMFQHEVDHLDGRLFIDHLDDNQKRRIALKMAKRGNGNVR